MCDNKVPVRLMDVHYTYPGNDGFSLAIQELSFPAGECSAVCGHNGSGKTTLGKLISGILRPSAGRVLLDGEDTSGWSIGKIGGKVGYLFQEPSRQIFAPTVIEEITFPLLLKNMDRGEANKLARSILVRFEMEKLENATTYTLSRGEKQRLAIAAMLVHDPIFIVLDEPTTGLDSRRKELLGGMIQQLVEKGIGILLISHDSAFLGKHAGSIFRMSEGRPT